LIWSADFRDTELFAFISFRLSPPAFSFRQPRRYAPAISPLPLIRQLSELEMAEPIFSGHYCRIADYYGFRRRFSSISHATLSTFSMFLLRMPQVGCRHITPRHYAIADTHAAMFSLRHAATPRSQPAISALAPFRRFGFAAL
jgi:hypothetical protein